MTKVTKTYNLPFFARILLAVFQRNVEYPIETLILFCFGTAAGFGNIPLKISIAASKQSAALPLELSASRNNV